MRRGAKEGIFIGLVAGLLYGLFGRLGKKGSR